jgi:hypothetical protein
MPRPEKSKSDLDRRIAELDDQLRELQRTIRTAEKTRTAPPTAPAPRSPWTGPGRAPPAPTPPAPVPPEARPRGPSMPVPVPGPHAQEWRDPDDEKRRFGYYFSSGPMLAHTSRPLRRERRQLRNRVLLLAGLVALFAWIVWRIAAR